MGEPRIVALIPARGGSKGIPRKNLLLLGGEPLIVWTIRQALAATKISDVFVSTEDEEIAAVARQAGAKVIPRPSELSQDTSSTESAMLHASEYLNGEYDYMVLLQCTSPLRYSRQLDEAIEQLLREKANSLLSGYENDVFFWSREGEPLNYDFTARPRRQEKEWEFVENGSFYICTKETLLQKKSRLGGKVSLYYMPRWMSFEIDTLFDFELIDHLFRTRYFSSDGVLKERARKIRAVFFDVDGVFTDGSVFLSSAGETLKFSRLDGKGIELLRKAGYSLAVISSEPFQIIRSRMNKLQIPEIHIGIKDKIRVYEELRGKLGLADEEICFCGDDIQDLVVMERAGFSCAPANARPEVKRVAHYVFQKEGGAGFVRDVADYLLSVKSS